MEISNRTALRILSRKYRLWWSVNIIGIAIVAILTSESVSAETLQDAMESAYQNNPILRAERAALRAVDEQVPQALSGWRPTAQIDSSYGRRRDNNSGSALGTTGTTTLTPLTMQLVVSQPLYRGGSTTAARLEAEFRILAAREQLRSLEQEVLLSAVIAYMDVLRDQAVLKLAHGNERVLQHQLGAVRDRFEVGEVTRADVAQAEARLSRGVSDRIAITGRLATSRANFRRVVGHFPNKLSRVPRIRDVPKDIETAVSIAKDENPSLIAARYIERASKHAIGVLKGELLPKLSLDGSLSRVEDSFVAGSSTNTAEIMAQVRIPIYQAGSVYSSIRQRRHTNTQRQMEIQQTEDSVREELTQAWHRLITARDSIRAANDQVSAARLALEEVKKEYDVGLRSTLDVLDAEQELLDARVTVVEAERDEYVAIYELRSGTGRLSPEHLRFNSEIYDPEVNYEGVSARWWGSDTD
tara:strand:+ start:3616 stop:5028 length:1413 start_codon:yes stop_codon:yes gene_type:complete